MSEIHTLYSLGQMSDFEMALRQIIREEVEAALQAYIKQENQQIIEAISEPQDEDAEIVSVLATLSESEWCAFIEKIPHYHQRRADEREPYQLV